MKVITLNLHCVAEENQSEKLTRVAKYIEQEKIDICLFQEVAQEDQAPFIAEGLREGNTANFIYQLLPKEYNFCFKAIKSSYGHLEEGAAVITRYPIINSKMTYISNTHDFGNWICRGSYETDIDIDGTPVRLFTTHLGWDMMGETYVEQYARMEKLIQASPYFSIVAGDFNHIHGSDEYKMICNTGLYDIANLYGANPNDYPTFHKELDSATFTNQVPDKFAACENRMIDFIFVSEPVNVTDFKIVFNKEEEYVSDHSLVYTEFFRK